MQIQNKIISHENPVFIIAEVGVNHDGDLSTAKELIRRSKEAGADAVKFQTYRSDELVSAYAEKAPYQLAFTEEKSKTSQKDMLKRYELSKEDHLELMQEARTQDIIFLSTPFDFPSIDLLQKLDVPAFKVSSGDLDNIPLLQHMAQWSKPIILSSGMSDVEMIKASVIAIKQVNPAAEVAVLHCTTAYPAPFTDINLRAIATLYQELKPYNCLIGYSDHTVGIEVAIASVSLGAKIIEKHITLDTQLTGPDHRASTVPDDFKNMVLAIRHIEQALGNGIKQLMPSEVDNKKCSRKGLKARVFIKQGDLMTADKIAVKRPEEGLPPKEYAAILGQKVALRDIQPDEPIEADSLKSLKA